MQSLLLSYEDQEVFGRAVKSQDPAAFHSDYDQHQPGGRADAQLLVLSLFRTIPRDYTEYEEEHAMIGRLLLVLVSCLAVGAALGQRGREVKLTQKKADTRTVVGVENEYLAAGAEALLAKQYDEGIRLTILGLERPTLPHDRANALSNLCAAYAAKREPAIAIDYCTQSIEIESENWRAYSNRAYAYYLTRRFDEADDDLDRALALNPSARQMPQIRGMLNERRLRGRVTIEEHN